MVDQENHRTLKQLVVPDVNYQPLCTQYHILAANFELKSSLIHLLPKFRGLAGLFPIERSLVDASSGGALNDKTTEEVRDLIFTMEANSQQFGTKANNSVVY
ncbi:hypothetical protein K1719_021854 [Acacia pycnantha]|nr:hypothetical protein K1719_021854 [Acacia pycnantha]